MDTAARAPSARSLELLLANEYDGRMWRSVIVECHTQTTGGIVLVDDQAWLRETFADADFGMSRCCAERTRKSLFSARAGDGSNTEAGDYQIVRPGRTGTEEHGQT
jgi:hypothetical protein